MTDARITLVTLGTADLARASRFYEALGWRRSEAGNENVVFLQGEGIVLSLFGLQSLAEDAGLVLEEPLPRFRGLALALNLADEAATDRLYAQALAAGGSGVKPPQKVFWGGYSGYFADPDGHLWEIAHNPFFAMDERGYLDLLAPSAETAISPLEGEMGGNLEGGAAQDFDRQAAAYPPLPAGISPSRGEIEASLNGASDLNPHKTERRA